MNLLQSDCIQVNLLLPGCIFVNLLQPTCILINLLQSNLVYSCHCINYLVFSMSWHLIDMMKRLIVLRQESLLGFVINLELQRMQMRCSESSQDSMRCLSGLEFVVQLENTKHSLFSESKMTLKLFMTNSRSAYC